MSNPAILSRRRVLVAASALAALANPAMARAAELVPTPYQPAGPFYPRDIPLDADNDLVRVVGRDAQAEGEVTHLFGRILDAAGRPVAGAGVEIWQCDARGLYHHVRGRAGDRDENFQGYGQMAAGESGAYRFRTIKPVPYPGRAPHIHFAVSGPGSQRMTTQLYIKDHPGNARDFLFRRIDGQLRDEVSVPFVPAPELESNALQAAFDIVVTWSAG